MSMPPNIRIGVLALVMLLCSAFLYGVISDVQAAPKKFASKECVDCHTKFTDKYFSMKYLHTIVKEKKGRALLHMTGERTDERLWQLPLWDDYKENLRSDFADFKNTGGRWGGAINGAIFLKEFVAPKTPWAHLDIAPTAYYEREFAGYPVGATAFGVALGVRGAGVWLAGGPVGARTLDKVALCKVFWRTCPC